MGLRSLSREGLAVSRADVLRRDPCRAEEAEGATPNSSTRPSYELTRQDADDDVLGRTEVSCRLRGCTAVSTKRRLCCTTTH